MTPDQSLPELTSRLISRLDDVLAQEAPDLVLAQGDTTTVMASALSAFYRKIPFGHVEAGLRSGNMQLPFPEEMNRTVAGHLASLHFAPTESARENLLAEGIPANQIHVTGNPVIDALQMTAAMDLPIGVELDSEKDLILVTCHRREIFGDDFVNICRALRDLVERNGEIQILYPVHPNPNIINVAQRELGGHPRIVLCDPLAYGPFISAMKASRLILTDSGGLQEEAPSLGKPVLVLRRETERPEAVAAGVVKLVGPDRELIVSESERLLGDPKAYAAMARGASPYGDGRAAERIVEAVRAYLSRCL